MKRLAGSRCFTSSIPVSCFSYLRTVTNATPASSRALCSLRKSQDSIASTITPLRTRTDAPRWSFSSSRPDLLPNRDLRRLGRLGGLEQAEGEDRGGRGDRYILLAVDFVRNRGRGQQLAHVEMPEMLAGLGFE